MRRLRPAPLVQFVALGAALYVAAGRRAAPAAPAEIVVSAGRVRALRDEFARDVGRPPTAADEAVLVGRLVDEELLYREALARGLDRDDRSVRWRLAESIEFLDGGYASADMPADVQATRAAKAAAIGLDREDAVVRRMLVTKMELLAKRAAERDADDPDAQRDYWTRNRVRFTRPATVTFRHVFLARAERGGRLARDATRALAAVRRGAPVAGDAFFGPERVEGRSEAELAATFGADFAGAVAALPVGTWSAPIASPWGLHLVRVERRDSEITAPLEAVRSAVRLGLVEERRETRQREMLDGLRARWTVRIEDAEAHS